MNPQDYPGIWVQFEDTDDLERAGINHLEVVIDDDHTQHTVTRYRFGGNLSFTVSALSNQERDRLYDDMVRVLAFTSVDQTPAGRFKALIEANDLIGININYDVLSPSGDAATPGTPWDTNEVIYEKTLSVRMIGEFVSDAQSQILYPLSRVQVVGYMEGVDDYDLPDLGPSDSDQPYDPTQWV